MLGDLSSSRQLQHRGHSDHYADDEEQQRRAAESTGKHKSRSVISLLRRSLLLSRSSRLLLAAVVVACCLLLYLYDSMLAQLLAAVIPSLPSLSSLRGGAADAEQEAAFAINSLSFASASDLPPVQLDPAVPLCTQAALSSDPLSIDRLVYGSSPDSPPVPYIVSAFRAGRVDWHKLLPHITPSGSNELDYQRLVQSERRTTRLLVYEHNRHDRWQWGGTHGPLADYALCSSLGDKCGVHARTDCLHNSLCGWCTTSQQCVDRFGRPNDYDVLKQPPCPAGQLETGQQVQPDAQCDGDIVHVGPQRVQPFASVEAAEASGARCDHRINDRVVLLELNGNAEAMYFHFMTEHFMPLFNNRFAVDGIRDRYTHFIPVSGRIEQYLQLYGVMTAFCPRYAPQFTVSNICFCRQKTQLGATVQRDAIPESARLPAASSVQDLIVKSLGLESVQPVPGRPSLALISRQHKRFILNELQLLSIAHGLNISARLLPIESMTLYEQVREFRRCNFLAGIHGSGLTNFLFLHAGGRRRFGVDSVGIQLMPYRVTTGSAFFTQFSSAAGVEYVEWSNTDRSATVPHPHFLSEQDNRNLEQVMAGGSNGANFFSFWINQDTTVDEQAWTNILLNAIRQDEPDQKQQKAGSQAAADALPTPPGRGERVAGRPPKRRTRGKAEPEG